MTQQSYDLPGGKLGPYSDAVETGGLIFLAGRIGLGNDGALVTGGIAEQTSRAIGNAAAVLAVVGLTLADVVKCTVYLADMADFAAMNTAYLDAFGGHRPARTAIMAAGLPLGALVEVDMIAARPDTAGT